jgi:hypothetical protein
MPLKRVSFEDEQFGSVHWLETGHVGQDPLASSVVLLVITRGPLRPARPQGPGGRKAPGIAAEGHMQLP